MSTHLPKKLPSTDEFYCSTNLNPTLIIDRHYFEVRIDL